ncbi:MAG: nuclease-related domain-containing protein [Acholeplasmataceae bacterium]|nr:nuclease-related domain-containing protein [Acholeplasmataceae bacterium]
MEQFEKNLDYTEIKDIEFVKDFNYEESVNSNALISLLDYATKESKEKIEKELFIIKNGFFSEKNVYSEIRKSRLPLLCLHDIRLEHRGLDAEFDFMIIGSSFILVIETKPFFGSITINFKGEITRDYQFKNQTFKDKIQSHLLQSEQKIMFLKRFLRDHHLVKDIPIYALAVIGSDETQVKKSFAKSKVKKAVIRYNQLIGVLDQYAKKNVNLKLRNGKMREISNVLKKEHQPVEIDYARKLNLNIISLDSKKMSGNQTIEQKKNKSKDEPKDLSQELLYKSVKDARKDLHKMRRSIFTGYKRH